MSREAIQDRLGACPVEEMREAFADMDALERVAVEQEVLRLCTARAVLVGEFLAAHRDLRAALGPLVPELPAPVAVPAPADAVDSSGGDVVAPGPDIAATGDSPPDRPDTASDLGLPDPPGPDGEAAGRLERVLGLDGGTEFPGPPGVEPDDREVTVLPPPGTVSPVDSALQSAVQADGGAAPAVPEPIWEILFTAKRSDGAWLAMVRETAPPPLVLPALAPAEGKDAAALPPVLAPRPPESALVSAGERLAEGGPVVVSIDAAGVEIAPQPDGDAVALPWASGTSAVEPGRPDFLYLKEGE